MLNIRLLNLRELTSEERAELAADSRKARPDAQTREEFAALANHWRERSKVLNFKVFL